jgi:hypothetical protein
MRDVAVVVLALNLVSCIRLSSFLQRAGPFVRRCHSRAPGRFRRRRHQVRYRLLQRDHQHPAVDHSQSRERSRLPVGQDPGSETTWRVRHHPRRATTTLLAHAALRARGDPLLLHRPSVAPCRGRLGHPRSVLRELPGRSTLPMDGGTTQPNETRPTRGDQLLHSFSRRTTIVGAIATSVRV